MKFIFFNFQDLVAMPDFKASAMENWALITFRREFLVYHEDFVTAFTKEEMMKVIAHELAHSVRIM
jgi:aminopeptidase N